MLTVPPSPASMLTVPPSPASMLTVPPSPASMLQLEDCTGRNFRILSGPARGPFDPSPKLYVTRTPPKPDFLLFQPDLFTIYSDYRIINTLLF
jgi:hypothetical protein